MKRVISLVLVSIMLLLMLPTVSFATEQRTGLKNNFIKTGRVTQPDMNYIGVKLLEKLPVTMEAWVYLPATCFGQAAGVVLGNEIHRNAETLTFSIEASGVPKLTVCHYGGKAEYAFSEAQIALETWTHVTMVYGGGTDNKQVLCYINGELKGASVPASWYQVEDDVYTYPMCVAGDLRPLNEHGFKGILGDVTAYSTVRTEEQIRNDYANGPDMSDPELLFHYTITEESTGNNIPDQSGNGYDIRCERIWLTQEERDEIWAQDDTEYAYTIAFLPDVQFTTEFFAGNLSPIFDYLLDNKDALNLQYLIGLGDLTNSNTQAEWSLIQYQTSRLDGIIPYSLIRGNHDVTHNNSEPLYDAYYSDPSKPYYQHVAANGGFQDPSSTKNSYLLFTVGQVDYMILNIDFAATNDVLEWADGVLSQYPNHRVIMVTHGYLYSNGHLLTDETVYAPSMYNPSWISSNGYWDKLLRKHANVAMVVSGHIGVDDIICTEAVGDNGNTVYQILSDPQYSDENAGGLGFITLMHVTEDGSIARMESYSTVKQMYFRERNYDLKLEFGAPPAQNTDQPAGAASSQGNLYVIIAVAVAVVAALAVTVVLLRKKKAKKD